MASTPQFEAAYRRLNPQQKQAVDTLDGPVMVVAGPGTGKTQVLTTRIANILLSTDASPQNVLALTFTESAASNMRQRLVNLIGTTGYYVEIATFHAFCAQVIASYPEYFPIDRRSEPLSDLEKYDVFQSVLTQKPLEVLKPLNSPFFYIKEIMKCISDLKKEGVSPDSFDEIVNSEETLFDQTRDDLKKTEALKLEKRIAKWKELAVVYRSYEQTLRERLRFDFDDMIMLVVTAFKSNELLLREYQEKYHYFLVDEYQDTNSAQNTIVDLLASYWGEKANIFVVGDPHQAIYRFQGASLENVLSFTHRYPDAEVVLLETGYRCTKVVYNQAAKTISRSQFSELNNLEDETHIHPIISRSAEPLKTTNVAAIPIEVIEADTSTVELIFVAEKIKNLLAQGVSAKEIAILYRNNKEAVPIMEVFDNWQIGYEIEGGSDVLRSEPIRQLLKLFGVIAGLSQGTEDSLYEIMNYEWLRLDQLLVMKVARAAARAKMSIYGLIEKGYSEFISHHGSDEVSALEFSVLQEFTSKLVHWAALDAKKTFPEWFEVVIKESGYLEWLLAGDSVSLVVSELNGLFREIKNVSMAKPGLKLEMFLEDIATMVNHGIVIRAEESVTNRDAICLSTVHKAKGREWEYVFMIGLVDGVWGNAKSRQLLPLPASILQHSRPVQTDTDQNLEDDRRLFYVGITRAKQALTLSYPQATVSGTRTKEVIPSLFVAEVKEDSAEALVLTDLEPYQSQAEAFAAQLLSPPAVKVINDETSEYFQKLVSSFKLSITALNTYLSDPKAFVENVLLKVPRAKPEQMAFGTAIHFALEKTFKFQKDSQELPAAQQILDWYEEALSRELLTLESFNKRLAYGRKILQKYYQEELVKNPVEVLEVERFFGSGWSKTYLDDIPLTGRIDRVDWIDKAARTVRLIDYKTGTPKTKGFIEGTLASMELSDREKSLPETIRGGYKRQLIFYKLLTELDKSFIPTMTEACFHFVEQDKQSGKIVTRSYTITDQEVSDLKSLIIEVMTELRNLEFLKYL